jgi:predicted deacylase
MSVIEVSDIKADPGEKVFGFLNVGTTSVSTYRIPIAVINGAKDGKTLGVLGGTHGTEFASIEAVIRIIQELDPMQLKGTVLAIPVVNGPQFEHRSAFLSPFDQQNQNRVFPGNPDGTLSHRAAHVVFSEVISKCDALLDNHGGDINEDIDDMVIARQGDDEKVNKVAREMAACYPTKYIRLMERGRGLTMTAMDEYGIPCVTSEAGTPYPIRECHIRFHYSGIINNLKYFGILSGKPEMGKPEVNPKRHRFTAEQGGIWHSFVELGQRVKAGDEVGNLTDLFGNVLETYRAPEDAVVSFLRIFYSVNCGESLIGLVVLSHV